MSKKSVNATAKPWRKRRTRRSKATPLNHQKKLGPKEQHK
jgi:hypothetical protein